MINCIRIGFTGTQIGMTSDQKSGLKFVLNSFVNVESKLSPEFHHGDCVGADNQAAIVAKGCGYRIVGHPPSNPIKRAYFKCDELRNPKPYLERNHDIVNECSLIIATPKEDTEQLRSGTWATVRYAHKVYVITLIILPGGHGQHNIKEIRAHNDV